MKNALTFWDGGHQTMIPRHTRVLPAGRVSSERGECHFLCCSFVCEGESFGLVPTPLASLVPLPTEMGSAPVWSLTRRGECRFLCCSGVAFGVPPNASFFPPLPLAHRLNPPVESRPANLTGQKQTEWTGKLNKKSCKPPFPLIYRQRPGSKAFGGLPPNLTLCQAVQSCASLCKTLLPPPRVTPRLVVKPI